MPQNGLKTTFSLRSLYSLLDQIYVQRRVSPLISSIGQAKKCSRDVAALAGSQHSLERIPPLFHGAGILTPSKAASRVLGRACACLGVCEHSTDIDLAIARWCQKRGFRHFCDFCCTLLGSAWRGGQESADTVDMENEVGACLQVKDLRTKT
ncbi:hypothetical protein Y032_0065g3592 [Ancylostoma ceylanicum]|uniref:Uncharacterized protein n=1 Tax=Ancylostoma ceylanicum TaxID=53326 RepID=A0A016U0L6_9BILA|nr:hypothetical protein Y032_0065g3592 [Ancylostoma ceylanicum]